MSDAQTESSVDAAMLRRALAPGNVPTVLMRPQSTQGVWKHAQHPIRRVALTPPCALDCRLGQYDNCRPLNGSDAF